MQTKYETPENDERGGALKKRFRRVTKRKRQRQRMNCRALASKMRLVETRSRDEKGTRREP